MEIIRCPNCKSFFRRNDWVVIDELNTVTHQKCSDLKYSRNVKHSGPYHYIKRKYPFLTDEYSEN